jgi:superfamily II DNA or RNA helicase
VEGSDNIIILKKTEFEMKVLKEGVEVPLENAGYMLCRASEDLILKYTDAFTNQERQVSLFYQTGNAMVFPKPWYMKHDESSEDVIDQQRREEEELPANFKMKEWIKEREYQKEAIQKTCEEFRSKKWGGGGLLCMPCGYGKTITALMIGYAMKVRVLIVCPTVVLMDQWKQAILSIFDNASVGTIQGDKMDIVDHTHVVASLKSLVTRNYDFKGFEMVVYDECHRIATKEMKKCVENVGGRYRLGLSATPKRVDGFDKALEHILGPQIFTIERNVKNRIVVVKVEVPSAMVPYYIQVAGQTRLCLAKVLNSLQRRDNAATIERTRFIVDVVQMLNLRGRKVILLADRVSLLRWIGDELKKKYLEVGMIHGSVKRGEREGERKKDIILGTYACIGEGFDKADLDTAIMVSPRVDVRQSVGRILRGKSENTPLVIDMVDAVMGHQFFARSKYYRTLGACMEYMEIGYIDRLQEILIDKD